MWYLEFLYFICDCKAIEAIEVLKNLSFRRVTASQCLTNACRMMDWTWDTVIQKFFLPCSQIYENFLLSHYLLFIWIKWDKVFKSELSKFFKGRLRQIVLGLLLNTCPKYRLVSLAINQLTFGYQIACPQVAKLQIPKLVEIRF